MEKEGRRSVPKCDVCGIREAQVGYVSLRGGNRNLCRECDGQEKQEIRPTDVGKVEDILGDIL